MYSRKDQKVMANKLESVKRYSVITLGNYEVFQRGNYFCLGMKVDGSETILSQRGIQLCFGTLGAAKECLARLNSDQNDERSDATKSNQSPEPMAQKPAP